MKLDSFIQLVNQLRINSISADDTDPNNIVLNKYTSPYDQVTASDTVRVQKTTITSLVWGNGSTYTAYDSNGQPYQAPSCGWVWDSGGRYDGNVYPSRVIFPWMPM